MKKTTKKEITTSFTPLRGIILFLLELLLIASALCIIGAAILTVLGIFEATVIGQIFSQGLAVWLIILLPILAIMKSSAESFAEVIRLLLNTLENLAIRAISILTAGVSEKSDNPTKTANRSYWILFTITSFIAGLYIWLAIDSSPNRYLRSIKSWQLEHPLETALASIQMAVGVVLLALPIRMLFSKKWHALTERVEMNIITSDDLEEKEKKVAIGDSSITIAHISDLHCGGRAAHRQTASGKIDGSVIEELFDQINTQRPDIVIVSGDITDTGECSEWGYFTKAVKSSLLAKQMILCPGNHDLNNWHENWFKSIFSIESFPREGSHRRALSYLRNTTEIMGDRAQVVCPFTDTIATLSQVMKRANADLNSWEDRKMRPNLLAPYDLLEKLFPMVVTCPESIDNKVKLSVVVWNSVKRNRWPAFNSLGAIGSEQIQRMKVLARSLKPTSPILHVAHHQAGLPKASDVTSRIDQKGLFEFFNWGMALEDPQPLMAWIAKRRQKTLVLHGHHHKLFALNAPDSMSVVISAPSATMGCEESYLKQEPAKHSGMWLKVVLTIDGPDLTLHSLKALSSMNSQ